jgi:hypothetical protein
MEFSTKQIQSMGKLLAKEMKRCGMSFENELYEVENVMRELQRQISQAGLKAFFEEADEDLYIEFKSSSKAKSFVFHSFRPAVIWSTFGKLRFIRRYYRIKTTKAGEEKGFALLDQSMGFSAGEVTPSLAELLALEGISTPFEEARKKIEKFLLFEVSSNTVRKETERFGALQAKMEATLIKQSQDEDWLQERQRKKDGKRNKGRIYGSVDGFMVPLREGWKEFKALAWYKVAEISPYSKRRRHHDQVGMQNNLQAEEISYHCDKLEPQEFANLLWATGCQRQVDFYEERIFVGDGAKWIWKMVEFYYPDATQILDWYHAAQYLYKFADLAFEAGSDTYKNWIERTKALLWEGQIDQLIRELEGFSNQVSMAEVLQTTITFFRNNKKRMDYVRFRKEGYFIGSGTIESAAKRIGKLRLKEAGARWTEMGAVFTAKARSAWLSDQWQPIVDSRSHQPFCL